MTETTKPKKQFIPKYAEKYYWLDDADRHKPIKKAIWRETATDKKRFEDGNVFKNHTAAKLSLVK